jgi:5-methylcytosine-specific restriction endonuclease McrA
VEESIVGAGARHPDSCPALVLNADYRPLSYYPLSICSWQEALKNVFLERVNIVEEYEETVRTPTRSFRLPAIVSLKTFVKPPRQPAFTRFNVFLRDLFTCQYCGARDELTFDHVVPRSKGGRTTWGNVVTACAPCNLRKGGRMPREAHMIPGRAPRQPNVHELYENGRQFPRGYLHDSWADYLYWDSELEP